MSANDGHQLVTFRLGSDHFAADIFAVERVLRYNAPTPVPDVPDWIAGVTKYQGRIIPVIDLRTRFGMNPAPPGGATRILVFATEAEWIGAIVDTVLEVMTVAPTQIAPPPPLFRGLSGQYLRGVVQRDERLIIYLDVARLLTATEHLAVERATTVDGAALANA